MLKSTLHYTLPLFNTVYTSVLLFSKSCIQISFLNIYTVHRTFDHTWTRSSSMLQIPPQTHFPSSLIALSPFQNQKCDCTFFFLKSTAITIVLSRKDHKLKLLEEIPFSISRSYNSLDRVEAMIWGNDLTSARQHRGWRNETMRKRENIKAGQ